MTWACRPNVVGDAFEEDVDARAVARDERPVAELHHVVRAAPPQHHVPLAGGDERAAVEDTVPVRRFLHFDAARAV